MPSVGELFMALGFDVDDAKLKSFKDGLAGTHAEMNKLGKSAAEALGIIAGGATALSVFVQHSADGAIKLNNMALMFGANTQAAQEFANALHVLNPLISITGAQDIFGKFSQMVQGQIPLGQGAAGALAMLGGDYHPGTHQSTESIIANLAEHYKAMKKQLGTSYGVQLETLGLGAAEPLIRNLSENSRALEDFKKYTISAEGLGKLSDYAHAAGELDDAFRHLTTDIAVELAPLLEQGIHILVDAINYLDNFNKEHPGAATVEAIAGVGGGAAATGGILKWLFGAKNAATAATAAELAAGTAGGIGIGTGSLIAGGAAAGGYGIYKAIGPILDVISNANKLQSHMSSNLSPGIMQRLFAESGINPDVYGHGKEAKGMPGEAYGIAQWHKDRQALFAKVFGHDIHGSTLEEQKKFVNYELMHGDPESRKAGRMLQNAKTEEDKERIFTKYFERPQGAANITITVNGSHSPVETAQAIKRELQGHLNTAYAQRNPQGY